MNAHTPGPWSTYLNTMDDIVIRKLNSAGYEVATIGRIRSGFADARLIAAAPELLEACIAMIEWDDREKDHAVDFHARMALCDAAFQKARAAIAKAEGQS